MKKPWSAKDIELLKKLYPNRRTKEVAKAMGRSEASINQKAFTLRLRKTGFYPRLVGRK